MSGKVRENKTQIHKPNAQVAGSVDGIKSREQSKLAVALQNLLLSNGAGQRFLIGIPVKSV